MALQSINIAFAFVDDTLSFIHIFFGIIPFLFYYTIVIKKEPRYITWELLYLVITGFMTFAALYFSISALIGSNGISIYSNVLLGLIAVIFGFVIWGVILHAKFRIE